MNTSAAATIDSTELRDLLHSAAPPRVLDVRTPGEFQTAHIAGAYNVPLDLLREHRDEIIEHLTKTSCWCAAPVSAPPRPSRHCARPD